MIFIYFLFREKMAFFTRRGLSVPEIPDNSSYEELHKIQPSSINNRPFSTARSNNTIANIEDDTPSNVVKIDRNVGVEV